MKGYYKLQQTWYNGELYTSWESEIYGDLAPAVVTNSKGVRIGSTFDDLYDYLDAKYGE